jgi:hypothetical protein
MPLLWALQCFYFFLPMSFYVIPENILHLGLDHLEWYGQFFDESRFDGIDFDNSNEWTLW